MKQSSVEYSVGLFMLAGVLCLLWLAIALGGVGYINSDTYTLKARFVSASGLKPGADVEVAGVVVGSILRVNFLPDDYQAEVELVLPNAVKLQEDAIASIRSTGIIGGKFLKISPGGSDILLSPGDEIFETESSINFEELLAKYIFTNAEESADNN